jgi:hypothetical protein
MLNDVLAVCVAGAVVVVIATILGAVELLRKPIAIWSVSAGLGRLSRRRPESSALFCLSCNSRSSVPKAEPVSSIGSSRIHVLGGPPTLFRR